jgi:serine protease Do
MNTYKPIVITAIVTSVITSLAVSALFLDVSIPRLLSARTSVTDTISALRERDATVTDTVKRIRPAVVSITITKNVPVVERYLERVPSNDFFGGLVIPRLRQRGFEEREVGNGSGFFVSSDGYIVTNRHVVDDEDAEYTVFTTDGRQHDAQVIARDPVLDIAVLKINGDGYPFLRFADSDDVEVGQTVIAIGNALGEFSNTVSVGVVSGLGRSIVAGDMRGNTEALDQLIQTDAAINPGNSGGPLVNLDGQVVGVNVAVATGAENISFALPGNSVRDVADMVQRTGRIIRPYLGVRYVPITEAIREEENLPVDYGVLVIGGRTANEQAVIPGSPAADVGIREGDIILEIDGDRLTEDQDLAHHIRQKQVGDTIRLRILRDGRELSLTATLEEMR